MSISLVENSYYDHEDHGRVRLVSVDVTKAAFQVVNRKHGLPGGHEVLHGHYEAVSAFKEKVEPADITIQADLAVLNSDALNTGD